MALDTADLGQASRWAEAVSAHAGWVKVGIQLYSAYGPAVFRPFESLGQRVFLDLKLHDIPTTVALAVAELAGLGAHLLNVHAAGGSAMLTAAAKAADEWAERFDRERPKIVAVTVLTSLDQENLSQELGIQESPGDYAFRLAGLAKDAGLDGVISSPLEAARINEAFGGEFMVITPGVRPAGAEADDQKRITTPRQAIVNGAELVVVGRPITQSAHPASAAAEITAEIEEGLAARLDS